MKITQYMTCTGLSMAERPLFPSINMSGAITVRKTDRVITDDFYGFGVAITPSSCYELSLMSPEERRAVLEDIYGENGIGLTVGRLCIGASDYSAELYSYDDVPEDRAMEHFSIDRDRAYVIPIIKEILAIRPDLYLYAAPWSPPGWMKTGGSICGGYMRMEYVDCYADYFIRFLEEYEACGIHVSAVTPQNEPETQQHGTMPACIWHPDIEAAFISALRRKLNEKGMDTEIWMYDYNFSNTARPIWTLDAHPELVNECNGVGFHYYHGDIVETEALREAYPQLRRHFTEGGPRLFENYDCDWCKWGVMMSRALNHGFSSFTGWNLMLDENGGPNIGPYFCGGLVTRNSVSGALSYSGQYKTFGHISRFFGKGAKIVETQTSVNNISGCLSKFPELYRELCVTAFENPDGTLVYILTNADSKKRQVQLETSEGYYYAELLPNSISTVVVEP